MSDHDLLVAEPRQRDADDRLATVRPLSPRSPVKESEVRSRDRWGRFRRAPGYVEPEPSDAAGRIGTFRPRPDPVPEPDVRPRDRWGRFARHGDIRTAHPVKVAICIPVYGMTHAKFTQSLASMLIHSLRAWVTSPSGKPIRLELETFMVSCSMLTESRHRLVAEALAWGADYMLCLDADQVFPADTLLRLLAHGLPVVGCNYPRRFAPTAPTAAVSDAANETSSLLYTTRELAERGAVEPAAHLGFGVLLLDMRVFDALQAEAEREGEADSNFLPLFKFEPTADKVGMIGEDVFFFRKLAAAGIRPFVDHRLSWEVGHLFEVVLTNGHAVAQREQWAFYQKTKAVKFARKAEELEESAEGELGPSKD